MRKGLLLFVGLIFLFAVEILKVYFIMPFPGSQQANTIDLAYFIHNNAWWLRILGLILVAFPLYSIFAKGKTWSKILVSVVLILYAGIFYLVNFRFLADKIFYQPKNKMLATASDNGVDLKKLVIGIVINGHAKAYPIEIIGYHHQVQDTVGGEPVMVTYCTVCRTGRIFSPFVNNKYEKFRLVGMDHFNAMFEDGATKSWWQQATGAAITGPLKGSNLIQLPSEQMRLGSWLRKYPGSLILQPDTIYKNQYANLANFDIGTIESDLERRDSTSWKPKSWVVGITINSESRAYDWNELLNKQVINDSLANSPFVVVVEKDSASFHVWNTTVNGQRLKFFALPKIPPGMSATSYPAMSALISNNGKQMEEQTIGQLVDINTMSTWNLDGACVNGPMKGSTLTSINASQEFWHSWKNFHPNTSRYGND